MVDKCFKQKLNYNVVAIFTQSNACTESFGLFLYIQPVGQIGEILHMAMEWWWLDIINQTLLVFTQTEPDYVKIVLFAVCIRSMMIPGSPFKRFVTSEKQMSFVIMIVV